METILTNQDEMEMNDTENFFINYGRFLERNSIENNNDSVNYGKFLNEQIVDKYTEEDNELYKCSNISDRDIEYMDLLHWLLQNGYEGNELILIEQEEYDRCLSSIDEEYEMDLKMIDSNKFFDEFEELYGLYRNEFENNFVSATYIDENSLNSRVNLIVKIDGVNTRFILDVV